MNDTKIDAGRKTELPDDLTTSMSFQERDTAPTIGERRSLLTTNVALDQARDTCGNYGALNNSREHRSESGHNHLNNSLDEVESSSEQQSMMGESVLYQDHVSQYTLERSSHMLAQISDKITFFSMIVFVLLPTTLMANGIGMGARNPDALTPMVVSDGCQFGLNIWYIVFTCICVLKLFIEAMRYFYVRKKHQESVLITLFGNMILMPIVFMGFFVYTQSLYESSTPAPDHIMSYREAQGVELPGNACSDADYLSQALFVTFQMFAILSYFIIFYYLVQTIVMMQSACLIKAIVQRRIQMLRRRDQQQEATVDSDAERQQQQQDMDNQDIEDEEGGLFIEGMFGGLLTIPLPIPEILSSLDKTKFKHKQSQERKKNKKKGTNDGMWNQCPVCWSDFQRNDFVTTLHCDEKHIFHTECIEQWIRKGQNSCPLCRTQIANL